MCVRHVRGRIEKYEDKRIDKGYEDGGHALRMRGGVECLHGV